MAWWRRRGHCPPGCRPEVRGGAGPATPEAVEAGVGPAPETAGGWAWVLIPAREEAARVAETVQAARAIPGVRGVLVVDDGSRDDTAARAGAAGARVLRLRRPRGKGGAMEAGLRLLEAAPPQAVLLLDADLGRGAAGAAAVLREVGPGEADMAVALPPRQRRGGGLGLVRRFAAWGVRRLTGRRLEAPLSGQRAVRWAALSRLRPLEAGFGVEVALGLGAVRAGLEVVEVPVDFDHRRTGGDLAGFWHRGRQGWAVLRALVRWAAAGPGRGP